MKSALRNLRKNTPAKANNRETFEFVVEIIELCPKSARFLFGTGINSEFRPAEADATDVNLGITSPASLDGNLD